MVRGTHTITLGTHNEFFNFRNLFIRDNFGTYEFASLDTFEAGSAQLYDYSFSTTGDPNLQRNSRRIRSASTRAISGGCARTSR